MSTGNESRASFKQRTYRRTTSMRNDYLTVPEEQVEDPDITTNVDYEVKTREVTLTRIFLLAAVNFGISAAWSLEMAVTTPYFAVALKSGPVLSHMVWVIGPISGLVVAPIVGHLSDQCTWRLGRRRPFVVAGAIGTFAGMMTFPNARQIADALFDARHAHTAALVVAVVSFAVMDFSINISMFPGKYAN